MCTQANYCFAPNLILLFHPNLLPWLAPTPKMLLSSYFSLIRLPPPFRQIRKKGGKEGAASAAFNWWLLKGLSQDVGGREEEKGSREGRILMTLHRFWSSVKLDWLGHTRRTDSFLGPGDANVPQIQPCHLVPYLMTLKEIVIERQFTSLQHILLEMAKKKRPSRYTAKLQNPFPSLSFSPLISCSLKLPHKSGLGSLAKLRGPFSE